MRLKVYLDRDLIKIISHDQSTYMTIYVQDTSIHDERLDPFLSSVNSIEFKRADHENPDFFGYIQEHVLPKIQHQVKVLRGGRYIEGVDLTCVEHLFLERAEDFHPCFLSCTKLKSLEMRSNVDAMCEMINNNKETLRKLNLYDNYPVPPSSKLKDILCNNLSKLKKLSIWYSFIGNDVSRLTQVKELTIITGNMPFDLNSVNTLVSSSIRLRKLCIPGEHLNEYGILKSSPYLLFCNFVWALPETLELAKRAEARYVICLCIAKYRSSQVTTFKHFLPLIGEYLCFMRDEGDGGGAVTKRLKHLP